MYKVTFNLPRHYNDKKPILPGKIREIEKRIIKVSDGLTRYNASGQWIENNKLFIARRRGDLSGFESWLSRYRTEH